MKDEWKMKQEDCGIHLQRLVVHSRTRNVHLGEKSECCTGIKHHIEARYSLRVIH